MLCAKVTHECKLEDRDIKFGRRKTGEEHENGESDLIREVSMVSRSSNSGHGKHHSSRPRSGKHRRHQEHAQGHSTHPSYGARLTVSTLTTHGSNTSGSNSGGEADGEVDHLSVGGRSGTETLSSREGSFRSNNSHATVDSPRAVAKHPHLHQSHTAHSTHSRSTTKSSSPRSPRRKSKASTHHKPNSHSWAS